MKIKFSLLIFLVPFLIGCTNDDIILTEEIQSQNKSTQITTITPEVKAITKYMARTHGVKSRTTNNKLTPFVLDGDTVMYISNYDEGWEVFSNDPRVPMVLMKSEKGNFYPTDLNDNTPFEGLFKNTAEYLKTIKKTGYAPTDTINSEWKAHGVRNLGNCLDNIASSGNSDYYWKLVGISEPKYYSEILEPTGGRLKTKWHQDYPYNQYTPLINGIHTKVGCVAIAIGQYFYFTHYRNNAPLYAVTDAIYNSSTNKYSFSGASSTIWDSFKNIDDKRIDIDSFKPNAIFLSWVGSNVNMQYGLTASEAALLDNTTLNFFNAQTKLNASIIRYNSSAIEMLRNGYPIILRASTGESGGHAWLIDHYENEKCITTEYYIYVKYSDEPNPEEEDDDDDDLWSHPTVDKIREKYGNVNIDLKYQSFEKPFYMCNWGWGNYQDDVKYNAKILSWSAGGYTFNKDYYIYYFN